MGIFLTLINVDDKDHYYRLVYILFLGRMYDVWVVSNLKRERQLGEPGWLRFATAMAKRWHQTLVIILCVVILSICQSSAVPRRRILRPTGAVMKPGRNPGGVPVGQFRSYKQQKPQIPSMGTQFVRNVQVRCIHQSFTRCIYIIATNYAL